MQYLSILLGVAALATAFPALENEPSLSARTPPTNPNNIMMFLCNDIPEVCKNMCYGAFCLNVSEGLKYDKPSKSTKRARRKAAGCRPNPNRCSTKNGYQSGYQCDEYPFASTVSNGGKPARVNRCVPSGQNSKQGATISKFYSGSYCNGGPCTFTVGFENSGNVKYCDAYAGGSCANDGNEEIGSGGSQRRNVGNATMAATPKYRTGSGSEVLIPGGAAIGQTALRVVAINQTLWGNQADSHNFSDEEVDGYDTQYDYMHENLVVEKDTIVERIG